jgi:hypothetical protein
MENKKLRKKKQKVIDGVKYERYEGDAFWVAEVKE